MKINKTNAARLLDKAKIAYELIPYEVDANKITAFVTVKNQCLKYLFYILA